MLAEVACQYQRYEGFAQQNRHSKCFDGSGVVMQLGVGSENVRDVENQPAGAGHELETAEADHVHETAGCEIDGAEHHPDGVEDELGNVHVH